MSISYPIVSDFKSRYHNLSLEAAIVETTSKTLEALQNFWVAGFVARLAANAAAAPEVKSD